MNNLFDTFRLFILCIILAACTVVVEPGADSAVIEMTRPLETVLPSPTLAGPTPFPTATAVPPNTHTPMPSPTKSAFVNLTRQPETPETTIVTPTPYEPAPTNPPPPTAIQTNHRQGGSQAVVSDDGRFITFLSRGQLTDNAHSDLAVFMRDMETGLIHLINVNQKGQATYHDVYDVAMSGNGRVFAYFSFDGDIVAGDTVMCGGGAHAVSCEDLFIYDADTDSTEMVALGRGQGLGADYTMGLSTNGRYVALGHQNNLLLHDRQTKQSEFILATVDGEDPNSYSFAPSLSADGRFIAFVSRASNLVPRDTNEQADVFVLDRDTGQIERVSVAPDGTEADGPSGAEPAHEMVSGKTDISADGRFITFASAASNLTSEPGLMCEDYRGYTRPCYNTYLHDREVDETILLSHGGNGDSLNPSLSADGRFVLFGSTATNLLASDLPACTSPSVLNCSRIYLYERAQGTLTMVNPEANGASWGGDLSADGRYLTFTSNATNLTLDDSDDNFDVFRYDRESGQIERISVVP